MADEVQRTCVECQGSMSPIVIMDKAPGMARHAVVGPLEYRLPDDRASFWTGKSHGRGGAGLLCAGCGRITLYGDNPHAEPGAAPDAAQM